MNYREFIENLAEDLQEKLQQRNQDIEVDVLDIAKAGETYTGLRIGDGRNISPVVDPKHYYEGYEAGMNYYVLVNLLADDIENELSTLPQELKLDLDKLIDAISVQLVSTERNQEYLLGKPHRNIEDLSLVYRMNMEFEDRSGSIVVTEEIMKLLGINEEEMFRVAMEKAPVNMPCQIRKMSDVLGEMIPEMNDDLPESPLMIVTNTKGIFGASAIMYPGVLEQCAEVMEGDFYIIPSSVHECLIHSDNDSVSLSELKSIVKEVNDTQVAPHELLSYSIYHYDSRERIFEVAEKHQARIAAKEKHSVLGDLKSKRLGMDVNGHHRRNQDIGTRKIHEVSL